jgi:hypothetical protein
VTAPSDVARPLDARCTNAYQTHATIGRPMNDPVRPVLPAALGSSFDIRRFHDAVLGHGALPLCVLRESVTAELGLEKR